MDGGGLAGLKFSGRGTCKHSEIGQTFEVFRGALNGALTRA